MAQARECTHALHKLPQGQPYYMHNMPHVWRLQSGTHPSLEGAETSLARPDHLLPQSHISLNGYLLGNDLIFTMSRVTQSFQLGQQAITVH